MTAAATHAHEDDVLGKAYDRKLMSRLLVYARPYRALMYGAFGLLCVEGGIQVVGPLLTRRVIDGAVPAHDLGIVTICTALFFVALVVEFITSYGQTWLTSLLGQRVMRDLRMEIFRHLQRLSVSFFDRNPVGRLITRVTSDVETLNELFTSGVVSGLGDLFTLIAISVAMLIMHAAGLAEIERAKADGRWESAYDSPSRATMHPEFQAELDRNPKAKAFFETLSRTNRYAVLWRIQTAKKPETRQARISTYVAMLEKGEKFH